MTKEALAGMLRQRQDSIAAFIAGNFIVFTVVVFGLFLFLIGWIWFLIRKHKRLHFSMREMSKLLSSLDSSTSLENILTYYLELAADFIKAPTFSFYVFDPRNNSYILKAIRHPSVDFGKVRPSYSGLLAYKKESYQPPISIPAALFPSDVEIRKEGEVPLLTVPIPGKQGLIRMGPITSVSRRSKLELAHFAGRLTKLLAALVEAEKMKSQVEIATHSLQSLKAIADVTTNETAMLSLIVNTIHKTLNASSVMYIQQPANHLYMQAAGLTQSDKEMLQKDQSALYTCLNMLERHSELLLKRGDLEFSKLPTRFIQSDTQSVIGLRITQGASCAAIFVAFQESIHFEEYKKAELEHLRTFALETTKVVSSQRPIRQLYGARTNLLKHLANMIDNASPYTVGFAEQMSRYSVVISQELGLPEDEIHDVSLAAYLSNIGVLGLSNGLNQKEGKYTEMEYELMKFHSEAGAMIVSVTIGNPRVASYILHHHERVDGNGYPSGLRGNEIPLGARIIAVVQALLAKINGRKSRDPLRFDQALKTLEAAAGSQLDEKVVQALINWFRRKQQDSSSIGRSLGSCWEMCCVPLTICEKCPAYAQRDLNCWEVEGNLCKSHGKTCQTCFVRTELETRRTSVIG